MNIEDFNRRAQKVKAFMDGLGFDFLITGSGALGVCGMPFPREPHDIDVEVACNETQEMVFKALQESYGKNGDYPNTPYTFEVQGEEVNVWCVDEFSHGHTVIYNGIKYATVESVFKKKLSYKRCKDILDLHSCVARLFNITEETWKTEFQ